MSKWIKWRKRLLKHCRGLVKKYPNLSWLPQTIKDVSEQDYRKTFFEEGISPKEAIETEIYYAIQDS